MAETARVQSQSTTDSPFGNVCDALLADLSEAASEEENGARAIGLSIDLLREAGALSDDGTRDPHVTARTLMRVASANLSVGRLLEGHINALFLINMYGTVKVKNCIPQQIAQGAFLGVWGADGKVAVTSDASGTRLSGSKDFASGLGTVTHAVVTVNSGPQVRLSLVDVSDATRANPSVWDMHGMKATASGTYDFTDVPQDAFDWIGNVGDYLQEPHFVGGVWRIAALQAGATIGLLDAVAVELRSVGRMRAEQQKARLMTVLGRAWAGIALIDRAAVAASDIRLKPEQIVSACITARLFTEEVGLDAIRAAEQSLGLQHFQAGTDTGRMSRDLSVYLRQAARDAFLQRAADFALGHEGNAWGVFR